MGGATSRELGHDVIVADPNFGLMYGHRSRRVKTDYRDVVGLAEAVSTGCAGPIDDRRDNRRCSAG